MAEYNFNQEFEKVRPIGENLDILIQVMESRVMESIYATKEDYNHFKSQVTSLAMEEREYNIIRVAQVITDETNVRGRPEFTAYRQKIREVVHGVYGPVACPDGQNFEVKQKKGIYFLVI